LRVAALGRTAFLHDAILACRDAGHEVVLIGTAPAAPEYTRTEDDFERLAQEIGCPFFCDARINQPRCIELARGSRAEAAISVNWPTLIAPEMLSVFPHGVINAHAGDLPRFRGNACPNWAILMGEERVVLTLHLMTPGLDDGPILLKRPFPIGPDTYIGDVYRFMGEAIPAMFAEAVSGLEKGTITPVPQPEDSALSLRCFPRRPEDAEIDWGRTAHEIGRLVRASAEPFAGAYSHLEGERVVIWRARPGELSGPWVGVPGHVATVDRGSGSASVLTGNGVLILEEVETASRGRVRANLVCRSTLMRFSPNGRR